MAGDSGGDGVQEGLPGEGVRGQASQLAVQASRLRQAEALGRYAKTDVIDADTLSLMAELATMDDPLWTEPTPEFERLRGLVRRRHQLVQHSAAERVRSRQASTPEEHDSIEIMRRHLAEEQKRSGVADVHARAVHVLPGAVGGPDRLLSRVILLRWTTQR